MSPIKFTKIVKLKQISFDHIESRFQFVKSLPSQPNYSSSPFSSSRLNLSVTSVWVIAFWEFPYNVSKCKINFIELIVKYERFVSQFKLSQVDKSTAWKVKFARSMNSPDSNKSNKQKIQSNKQFSDKISHAPNVSIKI